MVKCFDMLIGGVPCMVPLVIAKLVETGQYHVVTKNYKLPMQFFWGRSGGPLHSTHTMPLNFVRNLHA